MYVSCKKFWEWVNRGRLGRLIDCRDRGCVGPYPAGLWVETGRKWREKPLHEEERALPASRTTTKKTNESPRIGSAFERFPVLFDRLVHGLCGQPPAVYTRSGRRLNIMHVGRGQPGPWASPFASFLPFFHAARSNKRHHVQASVPRSSPTSFAWARKTSPTMPMCAMVLIGGWMGPVCTYCLILRVRA